MPRLLAATPSAPVSTTLAAAPATNTSIVKPIPKSVFVYDYTPAGRDPFFPLSPRRLPVPVSVVTPESKNLSLTNLLTLKGIIHAPKNRSLALINDHVFGIGETDHLMLADRKVTVRCLEIRRDSVVVAIDNKRHELAWPKAARFE